MLSPCKGCEDRYESCHASCDKYKEWRKALDAEKAKINKVKDLEADMMGVYVRRKYSNCYKSMYNT